MFRFFNNRITSATIEEDLASTFEIRNGQITVYPPKREPTELEQREFVKATYTIVAHRVVAVEKEDAANLSSNICCAIL